MNDWIGQYRPAPQVEQEQIIVAPEEVPQEYLDLEAMAYELDQMKIEATIDAERTRPGLNGFFFFVVVAGLTYVTTFFIQYRAHVFQALTGAQALADPKKLAIALGAGAAVGSAMAIASYLATRKTQRAVKAFEQRLIELGGTPLPERGLPLRAK